MSKIVIRTAIEADYPAIYEVIKKSFETIPYSDQTEHFLVERLKKSTAYIPALSLVATFEQKIIGFILLTKIEIDNGSTRFPSLALAPVSVLPAFQKKGIGAQLIKTAHKKARALSFKSVILLGHADYYPRFGYELTNKYNIQLPFEAPPENCMVKSLTPDGLKGISGIVIYSQPFLE